MVPLTFAGRLVGTATMLTGLLIVAFPIIILGANFQEVQEEAKKAKEEKRRQEHVMEMILQGKKASEVVVNTNEDQIENLTTDAPVAEVEIEGNERGGSPTESLGSGKLFSVRTTSLSNPNGNPNLNDVMALVQATARRQEEILEKILASHQEIQQRLATVEDNVNGKKDNI
eukprot:TRINITY_DN8941_c0_g1_i1.p1 TRINITY_DN8941_c0_g1~~TRINITY_DN8941_c0_g1_i1.p1  ORF type:complete len:172 (+),score=35.10 TRINITY_DN8941_c0_g1_i1:336-851(+)